VEWFKTLNREDTDSIKWQRAKKACSCDEFYTFSVADSDYQTAPCIKESLMERVEHGAFGYAGKGDDYEQIIQDWYDKRYNIKIKQESIIPVPTVLNGLSVLIDLFTNQGDSIIIQTPVYHVFKPVIENNQRYVIENPLIEGDRYRIDFKHLETLFKNGYKTFVFCNPHNPVGRVWTKEEINKLIQLANKYDVLIISDEIHSDIIMPGFEMVSLASFFKDYDKIIVISAPTKVFNIAGLQIAQIIADNQVYIDRIKNRYMQLHLLSPNLLAVNALKAAYQNGDTWVDAQNKHIYLNYELLKETLEDTKNFKLYPLEGTYLVWIKLIDLDVPASQFVEEMQKYGVFLSEGQKFGAKDIYFRMSIACSREQLENGIKQIIKWLKEKK
jgi:cystathionine beta-lyase